MKDIRIKIGRLSIKLYEKDGLSSLEKYELFLLREQLKSKGNKV